MGETLSNAPPIWNLVVRPKPWLVPVCTLSLIQAPAAVPVLESAPVARFKGSEGMELLADQAEKCRAAMMKRGELGTEQ